MKRAVLATLLAFGGLISAHAQEDEVDCDNAQSTQQINECVSQDLDKADTELNTVYKQAMASQVDLDKDLAETNSALVGAAKALKAAQRAWIDFRDANCESETYGNAGGTIWTAEIVNCQRKMTERRTAELKAMIGGSN